MNILVATDGSKNSDTALIKARKFAELTDCKVSTIYVEGNMPIKVGEVDNEYLLKTRKIFDDHGKEYLDGVSKIFEGFTGEINTIIRNGNAAEEIIKEADKGDYDLIIMGSRGLGAFSGTMLGSVSSKVLLHSNKDVLIVK